MGCGDLQSSKRHTWANPEYVPVHLSSARYSICSSFFSHPIYYLRPSFSLSLLVVTQIRGHIAGCSPLHPTTVRALHFYLDHVPALSSLFDSRRIVLTHARRSQQLILCLFKLFQNLTTAGLHLTDQHLGRVLTSFGRVGTVGMERDYSWSFVHSKLFVSILNSRQPSNRPEQKITQLTFAAEPRSSTLTQGCRHVGSECSWHR